MLYHSTHPLFDLFGNSMALCSISKVDEGTRQSEGSVQNPGGISVLLADPKWKSYKSWVGDKDILDCR